MFTGQNESETLSIKHLPRTDGPNGDNLTEIKIHSHNGNSTIRAQTVKLPTTMSTVFYTLLYTVQRYTSTAMTPNIVALINSRVDLIKQSYTMCWLPQFTVRLMCKFMTKSNFTTSEFSVKAWWGLRCDAARFWYGIWVCRVAVLLVIFLILFACLFRISVNVEWHTCPHTHRTTPNSLATSEDIWRSDINLKRSTYLQVFNWSRENWVFFDYFTELS